MLGLKTLDVDPSLAIVEEKKQEVVEQLFLCIYHLFCRLICEHMVIMLRKRTGCNNVPLKNGSIRAD